MVRVARLDHPEADAGFWSYVGTEILGIEPDLPTMNESMTGFEVNSWYGMMAPAGTPKDIVQLLYRETAKALKAPDVVERLKAFGLDPVGNTPEEHAAQLRADLERWGKVAKAAKIKVD